MLKTEDHLEVIRNLSKNKGKIVFVSGNFNIVHPGHLRLLRFAKEQGDFLVVAVEEKRVRGVLIDAEMRLEGVKAIGFIDYAFILKESPVEFISKLKPYAVVKGKEHENDSNPEAAILNIHGGKLIFGSGEITFSSVDLLKDEFSALNLLSIAKPLDFPKRHGFSMNDLTGIIRKFSELKICVIGDSIIDEYITCDPIGMSQEDPTIVVTPLSYDKFVGGAAIVAGHAKGLGATVDFYTVTGKDAAADYLRQQLNAMQIETYFFTDESRPTTLKQRYRAHGKTMLRVSHLRQHAISSELMDEILSQFEVRVKNYDLVIFSDFNYGCLPQRLVDEIIKICRKRKVMMVADSQSSSQVGDVSRFKGMALITPTEREARLAVRTANQGLLALAEALRVQSEAQNVIITLGGEGLLIQADMVGKNEWFTDRLPAFNKIPKDTAGAGDSFLTAASMAYALGNDIWRSTYIGSLAAACQVSRVGNIPLTPQDLIAEIEL